MKRVTLILADQDCSIPPDLLAKATSVSIETIPEQKARTKKRQRGCSTEDALMSHYAHGAYFTVTRAAAWMEEAGFSGKSASPAISRLRQEGYLKKGTAPGIFVFAKPKAKAPVIIAQN